MTIRTLIALTFFMLSAPAFAQDDALIKQSRATIKELQKSLKAELQAAIQKGGIVYALNRCHIQAPKLTRDASDNITKISRTSLRVRNPNNQADTWEEAQLIDFEKRKAAGESIKTLEATLQDGNVFRYMKAIPTKGVCLHCHGTSPTPQLRARLNELYPNDAATGFRAGDIRGAFTLSIFTAGEKPNEPN